jgi:hypothetical protein
MKEIVKIFGCTLFLLFGAISVLGQQKQAAPDREEVFQKEVIIQRTEGSVDATPLPSKTFNFVAMELGFDGKVVKKAPYSAQAITETTQTLADGNRIVNTSSAIIYRDSEGRTRREQSLKAIGPYANADDPLETIFINDPVAGVSYVFDTRTHTAQKSRPFWLERQPPPGPGVAGIRVQGPPTDPGQHEEVFMLRTPPPAGQTDFVFKRHSSPDNTVSESLGKQLFEGVEAEGTRDTITVPAGEIGNEKPIVIVTERWYSPELQAIVMSRHNDPLAGETVYRLTNISRSEPARSLFELPADYRVTEGPRMPEPMRARKRELNPQ